MMCGCFCDLLPQNNCGVCRYSSTHVQRWIWGSLPLVGGLSYRLRQVQDPGVLLSWEARGFHENLHGYHTHWRWDLIVNSQLEIHLNGSLFTELHSSVSCDNSWAGLTGLYHMTYNHSLKESNCIICVFVNNLGSVENSAGSNTHAYTQSRHNFPIWFITSLDGQK